MWRQLVGAVQRAGAVRLSEVLARQIGVTGRAVARAAKGPGSGGVGGASAGTRAAKAASHSADVA